MGEPDSDSVRSEALWRVLLGTRALLRACEPMRFPIGMKLDREFRSMPTDSCDPEALLVADEEGSWRLGGPVNTTAARELGRLYLPLLAVPSVGWCIAHLGQALDGHIATASGSSHYVTGEDNIRHLHRMRALCDVVVVGAETVRRDDPRLTTRKVPGESPVRAVIDPRGTLAPTARILDGTSRTLLLHDRVHSPRERLAANVQAIPIAGERGHLPPDRIVAALRARGLSSIFVEGGGRTVSHFLATGMLDRLQVTVAPLVIGGGRPGIVLPPIEHLTEAIRGPSRHFTLGEDVLFELDLTGRLAEPGALAHLSR